MLIIYTDLNFTDKGFIKLQRLAAEYDIKLCNGVTKLQLEEIALTVSDSKPLFWFAKSNDKKLHYYKAKESLLEIYKALKVLENHQDLWK